MRLGRRYGISAAQRAEIWRGWKAGESLHEIGRAVGKNHRVIQFLLARHGGIAPAARCTWILVCWRIHYDLILLYELLASILCGLQLMTSRINLDHKHALLVV